MNLHLLVHEISICLTKIWVICQSFWEWGRQKEKKFWSVIWSFSIKIILHSFFFPSLSLTHTHTHTQSLTHMAARSYATAFQLSKIFMPVVTFPPMETTVVSFEDYQHSRWTFHMKCCILKRHDVLLFFSPSTPAEDAALLYCMPVLILEPSC